MELDQKKVQESQKELLDPNLVSEDAFAGNGVFPLTYTVISEMGGQRKINEVNDL